MATLTLDLTHHRRLWLDSNHWLLVDGRSTIDSNQKKSSWLLDPFGRRLLDGRSTVDQQPPIKQPWVACQPPGCYCIVSPIDVHFYGRRQRSLVLHRRLFLFLAFSFIMAMSNENPMASDIDVSCTSTFLVAFLFL